MDEKRLRIEIQNLVRAARKESATYPPHIRKLYDALPVGQCFTLYGGYGGHVLILRYAQNGLELAVLSENGRDSVRPGARILDIEPNIGAYTLCGCGHWLPATEKQSADTVREALLEALPNEAMPTTH